jgi:hypothetical protein
VQVVIRIPVTEWIELIEILSLVMFLKSELLMAFFSF